VKLSEKLAALEEQERQAAAAATPAVRTATARQRTKPAAPVRAKRASSTWDDSKRQVRELVVRAAQLGLPRHKCANRAGHHGGAR